MLDGEAALPHLYIYKKPSGCKLVLQNYNLVRRIEMILIFLEHPLPFYCNLLL